jgi:hypothetical protein
VGTVHYPLEQRLRDNSQESSGIKTACRIETRGTNGVTNAQHMCALSQERTDV